MGMESWHAVGLKMRWVSPGMGLLWLCSITGRLVILSLRSEGRLDLLRRGVFCIARQLSSCDHHPEPRDGDG